MKKIFLTLLFVTSFMQSQPYPLGTGALTLDPKTNSSADITFLSGASSSVRGYVSGATGNFHLGYTSGVDNGYRLDVNGTTRLQSTVTLSTTPTTSAGTYDILTRNPSTGNVEKVASTAFATTASPTFTGTPTAPTATAGTNTTQIATTAFVQTATSAVRPYLVYTALISQSGTSAPTEIVLENTLGATATWSRSAAGTYQASFSSAVLTANKTAVFVTKQITGFTDVVVSANSNNTASIDVVVSNGTLRDSELNKASLEIRVYP